MVLRATILTLLFTSNYVNSVLDLIYSPNHNNAPERYFKFAHLEQGQQESRAKRDSNAVMLHQEDFEEDDDTAVDGIKLPNETAWWTNASHIQINYRYYELNLHSPESGEFKNYWIDIQSLLNSKNDSIKGEARHKQLANSYRRAVSQRLSFKFPFYGHETDNVTIATGGFIYAGDQVHSWLAATQYIAPLMANFDTTTSEDSNILYADTGDFFVVEWNQVVLRHQTEVGNFTFQVSLHKNGDIWFVYKNIPIEGKHVSDLHHPRKVGLSDAYLFTHTILTLSRRVIYEYHRVEVNLDFVKSGAVVVLKAQPVCIMLKTCRSCMSANIANFNCTWCEASSASTDPTKKSFCSDDEGLHRRRQDWLDNQCHKEVGHVYCNDDDDEAPLTTEASSAATAITEAVAPSTTTSTTGRATTPIGTAPADVSSVTHAPLSPPATVRRGNASAFVAVQRVAAIAPAEDGMSSSSIVSIIFVLAFVVSLAAWVFYAYSNPQTPSGQFLIRNRPAVWRWPSNHGDVRYTASSVHM